MRLRERDQLKVAMRTVTYSRQLAVWATNTTLRELRLFTQWQQSYCKMIAPR